MQGIEVNGPTRGLGGALVGGKTFAFCNRGGEGATHPFGVNPVARERPVTQSHGRNA